MAADQATHPQRQAIRQALDAPQAKAVGRIAGQGAIDQVLLRLLQRADLLVSNKTDEVRVIQQLQDKRCIGKHKLAQAQADGNNWKHGSLGTRQSDKQPALYRSQAAPSAPGLIG